MTRLWQEKTRSLYTSMKQEFEGLAFPICLNVAGQSESELSGGTSKINRCIKVRNLVIKNMVLNGSVKNLQVSLYGDLSHQTS